MTAIDVVPPEPLSREQQRSRRKRDVRARTISIKRIPRYELEAGRLAFPDDDGAPPRPKTRGDCAAVPRPCPFVSCTHHLFLDVDRRTGSIKENFPDIEPDEMIESCSLDVADRGGTTLEDVGALMNLTRERIRQIEVMAFARVEAMKVARQLAEDVCGVKRRLPLLVDPDPLEDDEDDPGNLDNDEPEPDRDWDDVLCEAEAAPVLSFDGGF